MRRALFLLPGLLLLGGCDLTAPPPVPTTLVVSPGAVELDALEAALPLNVVVRDQAGASLGSPRPEWSSEDPSVVEVSASGRLLARGEGTTRVRARLGDAEGWATVEVVQRPGGAELLAGGEQVAPAGAPLPLPVRFRITDRMGNPWAGRALRFELPLGGQVLPSETVTGADGSVELHWTLGPEPGLQSVTVEADGRRFHLLASATDEAGEVPFRIRLRVLGSLSPEVEAALAGAVERWERLLAGKLPPVLVRVPPGRCGEEAPALDEVVDDLMVLVSEAPIDGPDGTAALASPCFIRQEGLLPVVGRIVVDADDVGTLAGLGLLEDVVAHELGHVLGIGTLWELKELLREPSLPDAPGVDTHFAGPRAISAFLALGGAIHSGAPVPVENEVGGQGSRDVHWRQGVFFNELMTPLLVAGGPNPLSRVSAASLADLGYEVRESRAEPWVLPGTGGALPAPRPGEGPATFRIHHLNRSTPIHVLGDEGSIIQLHPGTP